MRAITNSEMMCPISDWFIMDIDFGAILSDYIDLFDSFKILPPMEI